MHRCRAAHREVLGGFRRRIRPSLTTIDTALEASTSRRSVTVDRSSSLSRCLSLQRVRIRRQDVDLAGTKGPLRGHRLIGPRPARTDFETTEPVKGGFKRTSQHFPDFWKLCCRVVV